MHIKTMAMLINNIEDDWPIAAALLGPEFLLIPAEKTIGMYVVLNEVGVRLERTMKVVTYTNTYYEASVFWDAYEMTDPDRDDAVEDIFDVRHK